MDDDIETKTQSERDAGMKGDAGGRGPGTYGLGCLRGL